MPALGEGMGHFPTLSPAGEQRLAELAEGKRLTGPYPAELDVERLVYIEGAGTSNPRVLVSMRGAWVLDTLSMMGRR